MRIYLCFFDLIIIRTSYMYPATTRTVSSEKKIRIVKFEDHESAWRDPEEISRRINAEYSRSGGVTNETTQVQNLRYEEAL